MPYPESCPECGGAFRNTGTHFTARRNEVSRHVLLELGCQNTSRRYWWDFTSGAQTEDGRATPARQQNHSAATASNGSLHVETNGHAAVATLEPPGVPPVAADLPVPRPAEAVRAIAEVETVLTQPSPETTRPEDILTTFGVELNGHPTGAPGSLKDAFVRQLQLDRLTLRQMRSWLMSEEARRAIEVAAGATEATYERLSLILFGVDLPQLVGKQPTVPASTGMSAEERLELQREKARIRARLRRAAAKAARQQV
jgi:hypothetical protein